MQQHVQARLACVGLVGEPARLAQGRTQGVAEAAGEAREFAAFVAVRVLDDEVAVAFLIFQDLAVVMMVLLVPMLGEGGGDLWQILGLVGKSVLVIGFVIFLILVVIQFVVV